MTEITKVSIIKSRIQLSGRSPLIEGSTNSLLIGFTFSPEWDGLARVAVFTNGNEQKSVLLSSNVCAIPCSVLTSPGNLYISVRGIGDGGSIVFCTADEHLGKVGVSGASFPVVDLDEVEPDVIDTLLADVAELKANGGGGSGAAGSDGKSAYEIAVENGFEGTVTEWLSSLAGADGTSGADGHTPVKGVDYFTAADKAELVSAVLTELPDGDEVSY